MNHSTAAQPALFIYKKIKKLKIHHLDWSVSKVTRYRIDALADTTAANTKATTILSLFCLFQHWLLQVSFPNWLYCYNCATTSASYCTVGIALNAKPTGFI